jgi:hypothetical protein
MVEVICSCSDSLAEKGRGGVGKSFIRDHFRESGIKADKQKPQLLVANVARLQAILIAGWAPQGPIGLLKSVCQHWELAAVAQRAGGTARPPAVKTVVLRKLSILQDTGQALVRAAVQVHCSHAGQNSTGPLQRLEQNWRQMLPTNVNEGRRVTTAILSEDFSTNNSTQHLLSPHLAFWDLHSSLPLLPSDMSYL